MPQPTAANVPVPYLDARLNFLNVRRPASAAVPPWPAVRTATSRTIACPTSLACLCPLRLLPQFLCVPEPFDYMWGGELQREVGNHLWVAAHVRGTVVVAFSTVLCAPPSAPQTICSQCSCFLHGVNWTPVVGRLETWR